MLLITSRGHEIKNSFRSQLSSRRFIVGIDFLTRLSFQPRRDAHFFHTVGFNAG